MGASCTREAATKTQQEQEQSHSNNNNNNPTFVRQRPHPQISTSQREPEPSRSEGMAVRRTQRVVVMRHGDRIDHAEPLWAASKPRPWDPPLTEWGLVRAWTTGKRLRASGGGWTIDRVVVSPFLRCLQTAAEAVAALCTEADDTALLALETSAGVPLDPSRVKVSIEYGLSEMMNTQAMGTHVSQMIPRIKKWFPDMLELEAVLPAGTIDHSVEPIYHEIPKWGESVLDARNRYASVIKALADKYPQENLLLVTHGEGVGVSVSSFKNGVEIYEVEYCAFSLLEREVAIKPGEGFTTENFKVLTKSGPTGIHYTLVSELDKSSAYSGLTG